MDTALSSVAHRVGVVYVALSFTHFDIAVFFTLNASFREDISPEVCIYCMLSSIVQMRTCI